MHQPLSAILMLTFFPGLSSDGCGALVLSTSLGPKNMQPLLYLILQVMGQGYRPSLDTFAPSPPAGGGYVASQLPDRLTHPEVTNHIDASARMHSDLAALRLRGPALGIDSDYIRVAHAYHCHLEIAHAHFSYAASHLQARGAARAGPYPAHLDHAPPVESCGRHSPVLTAPGASMSSSSDYVTHDGAVGTSPDPGQGVP